MFQDKSGNQTLSDVARHCPATSDKMIRQATFYAERLNQPTFALFKAYPTSFR